jgi:uncharacterized protein YbbC (DUF1343 family)
LQMASVKLGIDNLLAIQPAWLKTARIGLLANQASVDHSLRHSRERLIAAGARVTALFSPQHGYFGEHQANMIESDDFVDQRLGIPVFSLYGQTRRPTEAMLSYIDVLLVDLQDVGTRVYTFHHCEGNLLDLKRRSFVGHFPLPMRHGLTMAEMARLYNEAFEIGAPLQVFTMHGWTRDMLYRQTGLYWVPPSPNLPTPESTLVYPGQVMLEGTNLSEGRGTTTPFELWGAPYLKPEVLQEFLAHEELAGLALRAARFIPSFDKWQGESCAGFQIHLTDPETYRPYRTSLTLLQAVITCHGEKFQWISPPYEYEFNHLPIEIILGSPDLHRQLEAGVDIKELERSWEPQLKEFRRLRAPYLLYS